MRIRLGVTMTLNEISAASGGHLNGSGRARINFISTDSRNLENGDLFIAIKGDRYNGEDFVTDAKSKGAFVLSPIYSASDILHNNSRLALLELASNYLQNLPYLLYKIGITGSVGKTTTKEFLKVLLSESYKIHASSGNFNNEIGMPMSVLSAARDTEVIICEMGMNASGEISNLSRCLSPNIALITNIGTAHIGRLGSRENIAKAKLEIRDGMKDGRLLLPYGEELLMDTEEKESFSTESRSADYCLSRDSKRSISVWVRGKKYCSADFAISEDHHLKCLAAACSIALCTGVSTEELSERISLISQDNTRQKRISAGSYYFIDDCYNASRESMLCAISEFLKSDIHTGRSLVLGDILELSDRSDDIHFEVGKTISKNLVNYLFLFGNAVKKIKEGAIKNGFPEERIFLNENIDRPDITAQQIRKCCHNGEYILVKASRGIALERIIKQFIENEERNTNNE